MGIRKFNFHFKDADKLLIAAIALIPLALHLYTNAFAGFGYFRDEFYYMACANHPAAGYVDQPPLSIYILAISKFFFGNSLFALRLIPAVVSAITVYFTGLIILEMNGRKTAILIGCVSVALAPINLAMSTFFSMNTFDWLFWSAAVYVFIKIIKNDSGKLWIWLGVIIGLGLLNKIGILWLALGIIISLLLTSKRKLLLTWRPYLAGVIALIIFSPFIIWNINNNFAHLEFIQNAVRYKYAGLTPVDFISGLVLINNPVTLPVWILGIYFFFFNKKGKDFTQLGIIFISVFLILLVNGHSKSEYLAPAFPILYAGGGIFLEQISTKRFFTWLKYAVPAVIAFTALFMIPFALPILPVNTFIAYQNWTGMKPASSENKQLSELPQFYADMFGWEEMAEAVSKVYRQIPDNEKPGTIVFARNYGEAGALDFYKNKYPLPDKIVSPHNNYWIWGKNIKTFTAAIVLGGSAEDNLKACTYVKKAGYFTNPYCMPYESNMIIFICKGLKVNWNKLWESNKHFI